MVQRLVGLVVLVALVGGCGGKAPSVEPSGSAGVSESVKVAPSGDAAPVMPDAAKQHDDAGAKAFVYYWYDVLGRAMTSGDSSPLRGISTKDCKSCDQLADSIDATARDGSRVESDGWTITRFRQIHDRTDGAHIYLFVEQAPQVYYDKKGDVESRLGLEKYTIEVLCFWRHGWKVREVVNKG